MTITTPPHLLVFEPDSRGHAFEWIEHLLRFVCERDRDSALRLSIVAPAELAMRLASWQTAATRFELHRLLPHETQLCNHSVLAVSGFARWWTMRRYLRLTEADHGLFLGIDHATLPLALGLSFDGRKTSGILFRPSVHYAEFSGQRPTAKERLREIRKNILYPLMLRNPAVRSVYSLDSYFPAFAAKHYAAGYKVRGLVDPVSRQDTLRSAAKVEKDPEARICFAMFGVLTERKGILTLLDALRLLPRAIAVRIEVAIAGQIDPAIRDAVRERGSALARHRSDLRLRLDDRHLAESEIAALVADADVVLAPYQRFVGSSGVLMWAAAAGKPVITQDYGLLGRLVRDGGLGIGVDTTSAPALAHAIEAAVRRGPGALGDTARMRTFAAGRTPARFAAALLECGVTDANQLVECGPFSMEIVQK